MPKPFIVKVMVPIVNEAEPGRYADKDDARILIANALKFYLDMHPEQRAAFFDHGLELDGDIEIENGTPGNTIYTPYEKLADI